jgi:ubiquinone/menaquinone biosynthesis C-methylase UbiE
MKMSRFERRFVNGFRQSNRVADHAERLVRVVDPRSGQRLLGVGCGNGAAPIRLARTFALDVTGIDVDPNQIDVAAGASTDLPAAHLLVADATELPFANESFDLVTTSKTTHRETLPPSLRNKQRPVANTYLPRHLT